MAKGGTTSTKKAVKKHEPTLKSTKKRLVGIEVESKKHARLETITVKEIKELRKQIKKMAKINKYSLVEHPGKVITFQFTLGLVRGVGTFIGGTLVIALLFYLLDLFGITQAFSQMFEFIGL